MNVLKVSFNPNQEFGRNAPPLLTFDGLHQNFAGYKLML